MAFKVRQVTQHNDQLITPPGQTPARLLEQAKCSLVLTTARHTTLGYKQLQVLPQVTGIHVHREQQESVAHRAGVGQHDRMEFVHGMQSVGCRVQSKRMVTGIQMECTLRPRVQVAHHHEFSCNPTTPTRTTLRQTDTEHSAGHRAPKIATSLVVPEAGKCGGMDGLPAK